MSELRRLHVTVGANTAEFQKKMEGVAGKMANVGKRMTDVGKSLSLRVTAPIVGIAAAVVKTTMDFESQMARVSAIAGATGDDFEMLEAKAKELGSSTSFSASEAAQGLECWPVVAKAAA